MFRSAHEDTFCRDNLPAESTWPWLNLEFISRYPERLNASVELLDTTIEKFGPDRMAIIAAEGEFTYGQLP